MTLFGHSYTTIKMKKTITLIALFFSIVTVSAQNAAPTIPDKPEVVFVQGGTFNMGSNVQDDEKPVHSVTVNSFSIGKYPVTVGQYKKFCEATGRPMPEAPSWGLNNSHPVVNVNYNDAVSYCNWLGEEYGGDWRLPTEAEWEYAARGGNKTNGYTYSGGNDLESVGWFSDNAGGQTQRVGRKKANELGIYDMSGNVWEWCRDWYGKDYYSSSPKDNPKGPATASYRVLRGGGWINDATYCRVAFRNYGDPSLRNYGRGFRVVLSQ